MDFGPNIAQVAALLGDPARANMLSALMDGRALTASELAYVAHVTPQTTSGHLAKLVDARLLAVEKQGRHRYYRLASALVARALEGLMAVAETGPARRAPHWRGGDDLRTARSCYDHMAGRLAVGVADALVESGHVVLQEDGGALTPEGMAHFEALGINLAGWPARRVFCRPCLDWSERRPHLAGVVGAALFGHALDRGWLRRIRDSRALQVTDAGRDGFGQAFGLRLPPG
ncbi:MAG TPA: helix-turn-helix transcriptional regulator [Stellaceae bacterium]|jgi:DNA-binding transcriptional ArsR family regulator|nr:helix-turn-helix transcriptional regulator [Stellaceae bacterium]